MEKKKNYVFLYILGVIAVIGIGSSFAYFVSETSVTGTGASASGNTAAVKDVNVTVDGNINVTTSDKKFYPGHRSISSIKVTAIGDRAITFNVNWTGTSTFSTLNYKVYKTTTDLSSSKPSISCTTTTNVVDGKQQLTDSCTDNNFGSLGAAVASGTITKSSGSQTKTLISNQSLTATSGGASVYYYIVIEYANSTSEDQYVSDQSASFTGKVNVSIP